MSVQTMNLLFGLLTVLANLAVLGLAGLAIAARFSPGAATWRDEVWDRVSDVALPLAAIVATVAMLGSLYYSEVAHYIPCKLCWYQRIAMYSLAIVLWVATWRGDRSIRTYAIPLAAIGSVIATYHYQLERFPTQTSLACSVEAPCTVVWVWTFHYISLPFMALSGFLLVMLLTWVAGQREEGTALE